MKNAILYYYQLSTNHVHQIEQNYRFYVGRVEYFLTPYTYNLSSINYIYELTIKLYQRNVYCHQFVLNKDKEIITYINKIPYVLFQVYFNDKRNVTIQDIVSFSNATINLSFDEHLKYDNWYYLWTNKIDYFEYQLTQFGKKYSILRNSFSYFVGMAETAISLLNQNPFKNLNWLVISHRRIYSTSTVFDLYNPLNFIIDVRVRDAAEFFKQKFFENPFVFEDIKYYLEVESLNKEECYLFFVRMLFPTFYFDLFEDVVLDNKEEELLLKIIDKVSSYQKLLQNLYFYLREKTNLPEIEWLV